MMEARPAAALIVAEADFLLEVVIIALDAPAQLGDVDNSAKRASPRIGAARTRTRAKRDCSFSFVPSRQVMVRQACLGRLRARALTLMRGGFGLSLLTGRTLTVDTMAAT